MSYRKDLTGCTYGDYCVVGLDKIRDGERAMWLVVCKTCKYSKITSGSQLTSGSTSTCAVCAANKKANLTMKEIEEIEILYTDDSITKQEIADRYNVPRHTIFGLKQRFEWDGYRKKKLKRNGTKRAVKYIGKLDCENEQ